MLGRLIRKNCKNNIKTKNKRVLKNGAIGGKLLGAGGGGYVLFLTENKQKQKKLITRLKKNVYFKFSVDQEGSKIL